MAKKTMKGERNALGTYHFVFSWRFKQNTTLYKFKQILPASHALVVQICSTLLKSIIIATPVWRIKSTSTLTFRAVNRSSAIITLPTVRVIRTRSRIIITASVEIAASDVDARGVGVRCRVVLVTLAAGVVLGRAAVCWSKVAISLVQIAVHPLTCAGIIL